MKQHNFAICVVVAVALAGCNNSSHEKITTAATMAAAPPIRVSLYAVDKILNEVGDATLQSAADTMTSITINVRNEPPGERQPVFMMYGTCKNLNNYALYPLSDLVDGKSVSMFDLPWEKMRYEGPDDGTGPGPHHSPYETSSPGLRNGPPSFAITVWRYTLSHKSLVTCGDHPMEL